VTNLLSKAISKCAPQPVRELRGAGRRLRSPDTTLVFRVEAAQEAVDRWMGRDVGMLGLGLHLTVLYPFVPRRALEAYHVDALADIVTGVPPIDYSLTRVGHFPGASYLAPEPAEPFIALTNRIQARWPELRPYRGLYDSVIPHVSISHCDRPHAGLANIESILPITVTASRLTLAGETMRGWKTIRTFAL
jgi:2'-5' RNA ligase superfamily